MDWSLVKDWFLNLGTVQRQSDHLRCDLRRCDPGLQCVGRLAGAELSSANLLFCPRSPPDFASRRPISI